MVRSNKLSLEEKKDILTELFHRKMKQFGLPSIMFGWNQSRENLGIYYHGHSIKLSIPFLKVVPFHEMEDTLLHEIAHHMDFVQRRDTNHDSEWKKCALKLGARPLATANLRIAPKKKYSAICLVHGEIEQFGRMGKLWKEGKYCSDCNSKLKIIVNF